MVGGLYSHGGNLALGFISLTLRFFGPYPYSGVLFPTPRPVTIADKIPPKRPGSCERRRSVDSLTPRSEARFPGQFVLDLSFLVFFCEKKKRLLTTLLCIFARLVLPTGCTYTPFLGKKPNTQDLIVRQERTQPTAKRPRRPTPTRRLILTIEFPPLPLLLSPNVTQTLRSTYVRTGPIPPVCSVLWPPAFQCCRACCLRSPKLNFEAAAHSSSSRLRLFRTHQPGLHWPLWDQIDAPVPGVTCFMVPEVAAEADATSHIRLPHHYSMSVVTRDVACKAWMDSTAPKAGLNWKYNLIK